MEYPCFGLSSDNEYHAISKVAQGILRALHIRWDLYTAWRPQSSRQVERMNQMLKRQLTEICQKAQLKWPEALPIALLRVRIAPRDREKVHLRCYMGNHTL